MISFCRLKDVKYVLYKEYPVCYEFQSDRLLPNITVGAVVMQHALGVPDTNPYIENDIKSKVFYSLFTWKTMELARGEKKKLTFEFGQEWQNKYNGIIRMCAR
jgi:hypothetical protein